MTEVKRIGRNDFERLSLEELESLVEYKRREALERKKKIVDQAVTVLQVFGRELSKRYGAYHEYVSGDLRLVWDDYGGTIDVYWGRRHVFCSHETSSFRYNPGDWEAVLDDLHERAAKVLKQREIEEKKKQLFEELERFLDLRDLEEGGAVPHQETVQEKGKEVL